MSAVAPVLKTKHLLAAIAGEGQEINEAAIADAAVFPEIWDCRSPHSSLSRKSEYDSGFGQDRKSTCTNRKLVNLR